MNKFEVILCIVNSGFAEAAMDAAKQFGAKGGTVFHGRGTVSKEAEKFFNITIQPEKEIVMIIVDEKGKNVIMQAINKNHGVGTVSHAVTFSLPVDDIVGIDI